MFGEYEFAGFMLSGWGDASVAVEWDETGIDKTVEESED